MPPAVASIVAERRKMAKRKALEKAKKEKGEGLVRQVMKKYNKSNSGELSAEELTALLTDLGKGRQPTREEVEWVIRISDTDRNGTIFNTELRVAIHEYITYLSNLPQIEKVFTTYNMSRTGSLDRDEFREVLIDLSENGKVTESLLDILLEQNPELASPGKVSKCEYSGVVELFLLHLDAEKKNSCVLL